MKCPFCENTIPDIAKVCGYCRADLPKPPEPAPVIIQMPPPASPTPPSIPQPPNPQIQYVPVPVPYPMHQQQPQAPQAPAAPPEASPLFAILTLGAYWFFYPVGFLMNLIGLLTGPRRGCFFSLFLVFGILIPGAFFAIIVVAAEPTGSSGFDQFIRDIRHGLGIRRAP